MVGREGIGWGAGGSVAGAGRGATRAPHPGRRCCHSTVSPHTHTTHIPVPTSLSVPVSQCHSVQQAAMSVMMGYNGAGGGGSGAPTADILYPEPDFAAEAPHNPPDPHQPHPSPGPDPLSLPLSLPSNNNPGGAGEGAGGRPRRRRRTPPKAKFDVNDNSLYSVYCFFKTLLR